MFHFNSVLHEIEQGYVSAPVHIRLKPINRCNHKCYYCCYRSDNLFLSELVNESDMIPWEKMQEIISDLKEMRVKAVTFSGGGEPLIYPKINDTIIGLLNAGIKIATLTNGSALKGETARLLAEGASWVRISMDAANSATYAENRGVGTGEFSKVCTNIKDFSKIKKSKCQLGINFIINEKNYRNVYEFILLMKGFGVDHVKVTEAIVSTDSNENNRYHRPYFDHVKEDINKALITLSDEQFSVIDKFHDLPDNFDKKYTWCPFINILTIIGADQNIYTCQDKAYTSKGKIDTIKYRSFQETWREKEFQEKLRLINPSKDCKHHCVQHGKNIMLHEYLQTNRDHLEFV